MKTIKASALNLRIENIALDMGLTIESIEVFGGEAAADLSPMQLYLKEPARIKAIVTERAVADMLNVQSPGGLKDFQVRIGEGVIDVAARAQMIVSIPVKAVCTLEIVDRRQLMVRLRSVDVMGGGPHAMVEQQLAKINPVLDAKDFPGEIELESVELADGFVTLHGTFSGL